MFCIIGKNLSVCLFHPPLIDMMYLKSCFFYCIKIFFAIIGFVIILMFGFFIESLFYLVSVYTLSNILWSLFCHTFITIEDTKWYIFFYFLFSFLYFLFFFSVFCMIFFFKNRQTKKSIGSLLFYFNVITLLTNLSYMFLKTLFSDILTETLVIHIVFIIDILFIIFIRLRYFKNKKILDNMKYFLADQYNSNLERNVYFFIPEQCDQQLPHSNNKNNRRVSNYNDSSSSPRNDQYHSNNNGPIAKRKISNYFCFLNPLRLIYGNNNNNNNNSLRESYKNENSHSDDSENNNNNAISNGQISMPISQEMQRLKTVNNTNNNNVYSDDNNNAMRTKKKSKKKSKTSEDDEFKQQFQFENQDDEQNHADSIIEFREDVVSSGTKSLSINRQQRDRTAINDIESKQHSPTLTQSQKQRQSNDNRNDNINNNSSLSSSLISPPFESTTTTTNSTNNNSSITPQQSTNSSTTSNALTKPIVKSLTLEEYLKTQIN